MASLRLAQLRDRTPVKLTISVSPDLSQALADYAALYQDVYGQAEPVAELVPAMLEAFLATDRLFARRRAGKGDQ